MRPVNGAPTRAVRFSFISRRPGICSVRRTTVRTGTPVFRYWASAAVACTSSGLGGTGLEVAPAFVTAPGVWTAGVAGAAGALERSWQPARPSSAHVVSSGNAKRMAVLWRLPVPADAAPTGA